MSNIWDDLKIRKLQIAAIRCDFTDELRQCNKEATYSFEGKYICTDCLMGKLVLKIYTLENPPKED